MFRKLLVIFCALFALTACGSSHDASSVTVKAQPAPQELNLAGTWTGVSPSGGIKFTAAIDGDSIQIDSDYGTAAGIFWMGSFDNSISSMGTYTSIPDPDAQKALAADLFASMETSKVFKYSDGVISFDYSIMSVHQTISLTRSK